jgi:hypothetical protein
MCLIYFYAKEREIQKGKYPQLGVFVRKDEKSA